MSDFKLSTINNVMLGTTDLAHSGLGASQRVRDVPRGHASGSRDTAWSRIVGSYRKQIDERGPSG